MFLVLYLLTTLSVQSSGAAVFNGTGIFVYSYKLTYINSGIQVAYRPENLFKCEYSSVFRCCGWEPVVVSLIPGKLKAVIELGSFLFINIFLQLKYYVPLKIWVSGHYVNAPPGIIPKLYIPLCLHIESEWMVWFMDIVFNNSVCPGARLVWVNSCYWISIT